ncbi:MAG: DNA repair protein RadC [Alistipes sp.]|nr:DNA repair protein RadC [Alistipes sp.]
MKNLTDKIFSRGAEALSDEELIALLVAETLCDDQAVALGKGIVKECGGSLLGVVEQDIARLRMVSGLGKLRAMRLKASAEVGKRVAQARATTHSTITSDSDVVCLMEPQLGALQHEECWALYLASSGRVLERMRISQGGVQATVVDCKLIVKRALELLAVQIVLVHNHPSGCVEPSSQDIALTERVSAAANLFDIRLLDHVIISRGAHFSVRARNMIK